MIAAVPLLREASEERPGRPAPTVEQLRARPQRRVPLAAMVGDLAPFPRGAYRGSGLELDRTATGVQAWDPDARHLMLFVVNGGAVDLLAETCQGTPGVRAEATLPADSTGSVVAIALAEPDDAALWRIFLGQRPEADPDDEKTDTHVHHFELALRPQREMPTLRLRSSPLPEAAPAVAVLLKRAVEAGQAGRERDAIGLFAAVRRLGFDLDDSMGRVRGGIGLGIALFSLGYVDDATEVLTDTVTGCELDAHRAGQVCRSLAWQALLGNRLAEGERWAEDADRAQAGSPWHIPILRHIAILREDWQELVRLDLADPLDSDEGVTHMRAYQMAIAYCQLELPDRAVERIAGLTETGQLEIRSWRLAAEAWVERSQVGNWSATLGQAVRQLLVGTPRGGISLWEAAPLLLLATGCAAEAPGIAADVLRAMFLCASGPADVPLLALAATVHDVLAAYPDGSLARLPMDRACVLSQVSRLRQQVVMHMAFEADVEPLLALLFPHGRPGRGLVVASDGMLAGLPWPVLLATDEEGVPPVTEVLGRGASQSRPASSLRVASLADPHGDLPLAGLECSDLKVDVLLRRGEVTSAALGGLGETGLIHLGVHVQRARGLPELLLADGPMGAAAIADLALAGDPVVILAACGSAEQPRSEGVERSLADAFLRAGASAVVATRWPLTDSEAHEVFRPLLAMWPFSRAEDAVAEVTTALRSARRPPRVWASLAVYRA